MTTAAGAGGQPPPRRDNGLRADQFVALADVDPRLGEHLLDLLRLAEIAAYLEPSTDPRVAVRYRVSGPVERLYVHAGQRQQARAVVVAAAHEAGESAADASSALRPTQPSPDVLDGVDTDAEFARIVAGFSGPYSAGPNAAEPNTGPNAAEPIAAEPIAAEPTAAEPTAAGPGRAAPVNRHGIDPADLVLDPDSVTDATFDDDAPDDDAPDDDDDHFHPPPAPPVPVPTANAVSAVLLLVLGILVLLRGDLFGLDSSMSFPASVILMLAGSALLIRGLRDQPEPGDEPEDDGAAV